ncbi:MAG: ImmA/IrrE family metallo-endopeptidase [Bacteroidetes bacterium]|nr:ImmA/IrrE family metallo-endopeptidase [Bacteroidota bacterium]
MSTATHGVPDFRSATAKANSLTEIYSSPPIPVLEIAENNGVNVVFAGFGEYTETLAGYCDFRESRLYVNAHDLHQRQSFTIAHELGHWLLHRDTLSDNPDKYPVLLRFSRPNGDNKLEMEANRFAAHLLVPDHLLKPIRRNVDNVAFLASLFQVSRTMMEIRLKGR